MSGRSTIEGMTEVSSTRDNKTDTELSMVGETQDNSPRSHRRCHRRRTLSGDSQHHMEEEEEEELDIDDEAFMLERQKKRKERLEMQRKFSKKKCKEDRVKQEIIVPPSVSKELRKSKASTVDFSCQTEPIQNKSSKSSKPPLKSKKENVHKKEEKKSESIPLALCPTNRFCKVHGYRTASDLQMEARLRAAGLIPGRVRRSSSDGSSLAQQPTPPLPTFLRSQNLNSHASDSMVVLSKGGMGPENLLNPHLSSFKRDNLSSDDTTTYPVQKSKVLSRQDAICNYGSSNSIMDENPSSGRSRSSTMETRTKSSASNYDTRSNRSSRSCRSDDPSRYSSSSRILQTPDVIVTNERKTSQGTDSGLQTSRDYIQKELDRNASRSHHSQMDTKSFRSNAANKSRSTSDLAVQRVSNGKVSLHHY